MVLFCFAGGEGDVAEGVIQRHVLGLGVPVHILVVVGFKVLELLVLKGLVVLVVSLLIVGVTLVAVQKIVGGAHGVAGVRVRLAVEMERA